MGDRTAIRTPMAWQRTLAEMKAHGTLVAQSCTAPGCGRWATLNVDTLIGIYGEKALLWDRRPHCVSCNRPGHYMASPGEGTPYRPLRSGPEYDAQRRAFLRAFGFTRRDVVRIKAMAESVTANYTPIALTDLDVPYRVGCCRPGDEGRFSGKPLGTWADKTLLWWPLNEAELRVWRRRPKGPRGV